MVINRNHAVDLFQLVSEMGDMEKKVCNFPLIFAEMFKDEINANEEQKLYNGVKRIIGKYSQDKTAVAAIDEFISVISGGASLAEIIRVALDEAAGPGFASKLSVDDSCERH